MNPNLAAHIKREREREEFLRRERARIINKDLTKSGQEAKMLKEDVFELNDEYNFSFQGQKVLDPILEAADQINEKDLQAWQINAAQQSLSHGRSNLQQMKSALPEEEYRKLQLAFDKFESRLKGFDRTIIASENRFQRVGKLLSGMFDATTIVAKLTNGSPLAVGMTNILKNEWKRRQSNLQQANAAKITGEINSLKTVRGFNESMLFGNPNGANATISRVENIDPMSGRTVHAEILSTEARKQTQLLSKIEKNTSKKRTPLDGIDEGEYTDIGDFIRGKAEDRNEAEQKLRATPDVDIGGPQGANSTSAGGFKMPSMVDGLLSALGLKQLLSKPKGMSIFGRLGLWGLVGYGIYEGIKFAVSDSGQEKLGGLGTAALEGAEDLKASMSRPDATKYGYSGDMSAVTRFESNGNLKAKRNEATGVTSYGKHQINGRVLSKFLNEYGPSPGRKWKDEFGDAKPGSPEFNMIWDRLTESSKFNKDYDLSQAGLFMGEYLPRFEKALRGEGVRGDIKKRILGNDALQQTVLGAYNNLGSGIAEGVMARAFEGGNIELMSNEEIIDAVMMARKEMLYSTHRREISTNKNHTALYGNLDRMHGNLLAMSRAPRMAPPSTVGGQPAQAPQVVVVPSGGGGGAKMPAQATGPAPRPQDDTLIRLSDENYVTSHRN